MESYTITFYLFDFSSFHYPYLCKWNLTGSLLSFHDLHKLFDNLYKRSGNLHKLFGNPLHTHSKQVTALFYWHKMTWTTHTAMNRVSVSLPPPFIALFCWHKMTWNVHTEMISVFVSSPPPYPALLCWHKMTGNVHTDMIRVPLFRHHFHLWRKGG